MLGVFSVETLTGQVWFMHYQLKMPENGRKNGPRDKQTINKVAVMFLYVKFFTEK